jgi:hypothetical protein
MTTKTFTTLVYNKIRAFGSLAAADTTTNKRIISDCSNGSEALLVPNLIFEIEQYNVLLIKLSKLTQLDQHTLALFRASSLNRDFRIAKRELRNNKEHHNGDEKRRRLNLATTRQ